MTQLVWFDHKLFIWIQENLHGSLLDFSLVIIRDKFFWLPFYIILLSFIIIEYRKSAIYLFLAGVMVVLLTDQVNSNILKKRFKRIRPCNELYFKEHFTPLIQCSGGYSFPSSHAANHAGIGVFLFYLFKRRFNRIRYFLLIWPILIGFSQVFVGVHFPLDIIFGLFVGFSIGIGISFLTKHFIFKYAPEGTIF